MFRRRAASFAASPCISSTVGAARGMAGFSELALLSVTAHKSRSPSASTLHGPALSAVSAASADGELAVQERELFVPVRLPAECLEARVGEGVHSVICPLQRLMRTMPPLPFGW